MTSSPAIRREAWYKLWGNLTMNPVSALTGATGDRMLDDPLVRNFCSAAMLEAQAIGARIGCAIEQTPEERHAVTRELGAFKTSMLLDVERGRPIELDAIVTVVHELGKRTGVADPHHRRAARPDPALRPFAWALSGGRQFELVGAQHGPLIGLLDDDRNALAGLEAVGRHRPLSCRYRPSGSRPRSAARH